MISTSGRKILMQFVSDVKTLLTNNIISSLQQHYGIWADGRVIPVSQLTTSNADIIYRARMLRGRLQYIKNSLPADSTDIDKKAVQQLTAEQAFTILNRFCAVRMCEERELIMPSIGDGYDSDGFVSYDMVTGQGSVGSRYERYCWYIQSLYDELSIELPSVFDRYSPYGLIWPDETTLTKLFDLINNENLTAFYDDQTGETVDFWREDETLGWIFQYYNSLEERRKMRDESNRPRNSREMAVRNQFFTPDYVVRFLTDNSLGRIWYEMTDGKTSITDLCQYMIHRPDEVLTPRFIKEPTELSMLDCLWLYAFWTIYLRCYGSHLHGCLGQSARIVVAISLHGNPGIFCSLGSQTYFGKQHLWCGNRSSCLADCRSFAVAPCSTIVE